MHLRKLKPNFIRKDERGIFSEALNEGIWENVAYGKMKRGSVMGNHYHKKTSVYFFITSGSAKIKTIHAKTKKIDSVELNPHEGVLLTPWYSHAILFEKNSSFIMGKSIRYNPKSPDTYELVVPGVPRKNPK